VFTFNNFRVHVPSEYAISNLVINFMIFTPFKRNVCGDSVMDVSENMMTLLLFFLAKRANALNHGSGLFF
jgi:hypothetical protein